MEMKERHVYRTTCFAQSSSDFFSIKSKMMDITWRYCALVIRLPPPPPPGKKDVLFHQTKISLFNSSCLLLTGNKSNTAGRKSVDLKNKTKQTNALNLIQDFGLSPGQRAPTRDVITLHIRCSRLTSVGEGTNFPSTIQTSTKSRRCIAMSTLFSNKTLTKGAFLSVNPKRDFRT